MDLEPARYQLIVMMKDRAAEQTANARRAEQLREAEAEQMRKAAIRRRIDKISPVVGILALVFGWGPVAVYFGIRARRTQQSGCLSAICLYGGLIETIALVILIVLSGGSH